MKTLTNTRLITFITLTTLAACAPAAEDCADSTDCDVSEDTEETNEDSNQLYVKRGLSSDLSAGLEILARSVGAEIDGYEEVDPSTPGMRADADAPEFLEASSSSSMTVQVADRKFAQMVRDQLNRWNESDNGEYEQAMAVTGQVIGMALVDDCEVRGAIVGAFNEGVLEGSTIQNGNANEVQIQGVALAPEGIEMDIFEGLYSDIEDSSGTMLGLYKEPGLSPEGPFGTFAGSWGEQSNSLTRVEGSFSGVLLGEDHPHNGLFMGFWSVCDDDQETEEHKGDDAEFEAPDQRPEIIEKP